MRYPVHWQDVCEASASALFGHCLVWPELTDCHYHGRHCRYSLLVTADAARFRICAAAKLRLQSNACLSVPLSLPVGLSICLVPLFFLARTRTHPLGRAKFKRRLNNPTKMDPCPTPVQLRVGSPAFSGLMCAFRVSRFVCSAFVCVFWHTSICLACWAYYPAKDKDESEGFAVVACVFASLCLPRVCPTAASVAVL